MRVKTRSAGVVVVRRFDDGLRCLLLRCYGYWDFPKGEVEPGEDPLQAARREAAEETSLTDLDLRWGDIHVETPAYGKGKVARYYLAESAVGEVDLPVSLALGRPEHQEYRWATFAQARTLLNDRVRAVLAWAVGRIEG